MFIRDSLLNEPFGTEQVDQRILPGNHHVGSQCNLRRVALSQDRFDEPRRCDGSGLGIVAKTKRLEDPDAGVDAVSLEHVVINDETSSIFTRGAWVQMAYYREQLLEHSALPRHARCRRGRSRLYGHVSLRRHAIAPTLTLGYPRRAVRPRISANLTRSCHVNPIPERP